MRNLSIIFLFLTFIIGAHAQTLEELKTQKGVIEDKLGPLKAEVDALQAQVNTLNKKITEFPGWYYGYNGILGANLLGRSNWFNAGDLRNSQATTLSTSLGGFANRLEDKYFWRNAAGLNIGLQRLQLGNEDIDPKFEPVSDILTINSLFGYKLTSKLAASALGDYKTSVVRQFNDPGYLDMGVGVTYTPIKDMVLVFHPLNYNFIFTKDATQFTPSLGCKLMGDYKTTIANKISWRSNLTGFISYKSNTPSLHNSTWINTFALNVWRGLGIGAEVGLKWSPQENAILSVGNTTLQNYYTIGLSYSL